MARWLLTIAFFVGLLIVTGNVINAIGAIYGQGDAYGHGYALGGALFSILLVMGGSALGAAFLALLILLSFAGGLFYISRAIATRLTHHRA
jgi:hypothetical protein